MTVRTFTINVTAPVTGVPAWFQALAEKRWTAIASASDATLNNAFANPPQPTLTSSFDITKAYSGACVDQSRGEYLMAANGGHANYYGNEVYALGLRSETPKWYRLLDRTGNQYVFKPTGPIVTSGDLTSTSNLISGQQHIPGGYAAMFADGRMRAQHGWHSNVFANGKVWYPHQSSPSGIGYSSAAAWSFDRAYPGLATAPGQTPLAHPGQTPGISTPGPWTWLGPSDGSAKGDTLKGQSFGTAPVAAYDPVDQKVWCAGEAMELSRWSSINTLTSAITGYSGSGGSVRACWAAVVYDPSGSDLWRYFVVNSRDYPDRLYLLNLKLATPTWSFVTVSNTAVNRSGLGAVYHAPSRSILCYDASDIRDGSLFKIRVPTSGDAYAGGTWQVSTISPGSGSANPSTGAPSSGGPASGQYTWSKFNIVEDMGNGQSALVVCMDTNLPTYVYKLPVGELT